MVCPRHAHDQKVVPKGLQNSAFRIPHSAFGSGFAGLGQYLHVSPFLFFSAPLHLGASFYGFDFMLLFNIWLKLRGNQVTLWINSAARARAVSMSKPFRASSNSASCLS